MANDGISAKAQILVRRPRDDVFNAFIDPAVMSRYWFTRRDAGLREGETVTWFVGDAHGAYEIEVRVKSIRKPSEIVIDWGEGDRFTTVTWSLDQLAPELTRLKIEERGFIGNPEEILAQALDSTGGFNQVVVALKAFLEHGASINIVADHVSTVNPEG